MKNLVEESFLILALKLPFYGAIFQEEKKRLNTA